MNFSDKGIELLKKFESLELKAYKDVAGVLTIGYGHTGDVIEGQEITEATAEKLLRKDLARFENAVQKLVAVPVNQNQYDALVSLAYNIGVKNFKMSTLLAKLNDNDFDGASKEFTRWNKARIKGVLQEVKGLTNRRLIEQKLFNEI